jgi:hypothetical protein
MHLSNRRFRMVLASVFLHVQARRVAKTAKKEEKKLAKRDRHEGHKARGSSPGRKLDKRSPPKERADQPSSDRHHSKRHKHSHEQ